VSGIFVLVSLRRIPLPGGCAAQQPIPVNHAVLVLGDIDWVECPPVPGCVTH